MTIKNVSIGDKFQHPGKAKSIYTVVDFVERKSMKTGEIVSYECWTEHQFCGQTIKAEVPFTMVLRYKIY